MKIIMHIPHYGWAFSLSTSMPNDTFYIVNKIEPGEQRGTDLCVSNGYWQWLRELKPKPGNIKLLGKGWAEINQDDYDVAILIPDAGQITLMQKYLSKIPIVWKFHLSNKASKDSILDLQIRTGKSPLREYPCIFSSSKQKEFYGINGEVAWSQSPEVYKDWKGEIPRVMWTCERIGIPTKTDVRYMSRGGYIWDQVRTEIPGIRYGLDFRLGTPITPFEELLFAYRINRCYIECATETILTDGLVEAMMTGMPPVVYDAWEMGKVIENGVNGFKSKDPKDLIRYCKILIDDYDLAKEIGKKARETAIKYWNPQITQEVYHNAFNKSFEVYNKDSKFPKIPIPSEMKLEISRGDEYLLEISKKTVRELAYHFDKRHTGILECPYCFERFRIVHQKDMHFLESLDTSRDPSERRTPVVKYVWKKPELDEMKIEIKSAKDLAKSKKTCPHCHSDQVRKIGLDTAICDSCRRILGKWIEWATE